MEVEAEAIFEEVEVELIDGIYIPLLNSAESQSTLKGISNNW